MEEEFQKLSIEDREASEQNQKARYNKLVLDAKERARQGQLEEALDLFQSAYKIHKSFKLEKRISKLKEFIKEYTEEPEGENEQEEEESDDGLVDVGNGYRIAKEIKEALYPYQIQALLWFWKLFKRHQGGILGDDMGLGKTIQVIAFLSGMFDCEHIRSALIVMPVAVIENWEKEFNKWTPGIRVKCFHGNSKKERLKDLHKVQQKNGVCLTTYGMVVSNYETLSKDINGRDFKWDYIILDEGHKIKNPTKTSKGIRAIPAKNHFILTGTPIQNNLKEMWALFDFVCQGQLLGSARTFKTEFEAPIVRAREKDASAYQMKIGNEMAKSLRKLIEPHFLRRTKAEVLKKKSEHEVDACKQDNTTSKTPLKVSCAPKMLTRKNDFIVWLHLSQAQLKIYTDFVKLDEIKELLMSNRSPLAELNVLKKICDHPRLLSSMACSKLGLDENARIIDLDDADKENRDDSNQGVAGGVSDAVLIQESGKMVFLVALLDNLKAEGHRCLVFSQSRKMLDMIQRVIVHRGHKVLRIDGTIKSTAEREHLITTFQNNESYNCFLLTTQVGGVGLTLTGADRVVIFDPSWNPATDAQAVDRAYRIGQTRSVVIYRLITCGSIEEKIYRKQVFKCALSQQTTGSSKNPYRYFTSQDLRELFTLDDPGKSKTQLQLNKMHAKHRKSDEELDQHISFLHTLGIFGLSDHDLIYSQEATESLEELEQSSANHEAIQARVLRAQHMVAAESSGGGHPTQSVLPAPYQNPKSLLKPIDVDSIKDEATKTKIQTHLHNFEVFKPKKEDTKRFKPNIKKPAAAIDVIDLSTPPMSPLKNNNKPDKKQEDITLPDDIEASMANLSIVGNERLLSDSSQQNDGSKNSSSSSPESSDSSTKLFDNDNSREASLNIKDAETQETKYTEVSITNEEPSSPETIDLSHTNHNDTKDIDRQDMYNNSPAAMESSVRLSSTINPEIEQSSTYSPEPADLSCDVFIQENNSLQNSTEFPNFQVNMLSAGKSNKDDTSTISSKRPQEGCLSYKEDEVIIEPNDIINNILVASPVVRISDKPQTPIRRKSSSKNRRKSVSQMLFQKSDSEDSDDEVVKKSKTPRRVRKIESDEESDEEEHVSNGAQRIRNVESNVEISDFSSPMEQQNQTDDEDDEDGDVGGQRRVRTIISDDEDNEISTQPNDALEEGDMATVNRKQKKFQIDSDIEDEESMESSSRSKDTDGSEDEGTGSPSEAFGEGDRVTDNRKLKESLIDSEAEDAESTGSSNSNVSDGTSEDEGTGSPSGAFGEGDRASDNRKQKESLIDSKAEDAESTGSSNSNVSDGETDGEDEIHTRKSRVRGLDSTDESSDRDSFESEGYSPQKNFPCPNDIHKSSAVKILRCECVLSEKEKDTYNDLVAAARRQEDKYLALEKYLDALKISSSDLRVHKEALMLVRELGLGP